LYSALAIALTFPLILHLTSVIPSDLGDPLLSTSILWWNAHVLPLTERWWNGFAFAPAHGMLAFSDHRLGVSLFATPLQWFGASPVTAYNVVFLATFPLSALGAHALGYTLTRRHDAAAICGVAFGFNPFRVAHLSHLELLAAFAMPIALAALHLFLRSRDRKWMIVFAVALLIQGLSATYYLLFFLVLLGLWVLWFVRDRQTMTYIAAACAAVGAALLPIAIAYQRIHAFHGFQRTFSEVLFYSGDVASFITASPRLVLWGFTYPLSFGPEHELFPGLTIVVLTAIGLVLAIRRRTSDAAASRLSVALLLGSVLAAAASLSFDIWRQWSVRAGALRFQVTDSYKPASIALLLFIIAVAVRPSARSVWRRRSVLAFYSLAAAFLFLCSLGPAPTFFGEQILYSPPYRWLMALPVFATGVRVPARFVMVGILALATAAALAFDRLRVGASTRRAITVIALAGIIADTWTHQLELLPPPAMWPMPAKYEFGTVIELPLMVGAGDFAAMYRSTLHGHPVANGQSGFFPVHYEALQLAFNDGNPRGLDALAQPRPLLVAIDRTADVGGKWNHIVEQAERIIPLGGDKRWALYGLPPPTPVTCSGHEIPVVSATHATMPLDMTRLQDGDATTVWSTSEPQQFDDTIQLDVGRMSQLCTLRVALGSDWRFYPRDIDVTTSADGTTWTRQFKGSPAGLMVRGAIEDPLNIWLTMPLHDASARFVRMRLDAPHLTAPWVMAELRIIGH